MLKVRVIFGSSLRECSVFYIFILTATNGWSNLYYGWGAEDDDFYWRLLRGTKKNITRPNLEIGRYDVAHHKDPKEKNTKVMGMLLRTEHGKSDLWKDGLNTLRI